MNPKFFAELDATPDTPVAVLRPDGDEPERPLHCPNCGGPADVGWAHVGPTDGFYYCDPGDTKR